MADENRVMNEFPTKISFNARGIKRFFTDLDAFFADRVLYKTEMIKSWEWFGQSLLKDSSDYKKAFAGKHGWLFLGNDYNSTIDKLIGLDTAIDRRRSDKFINRTLKGLDHFPDACKIVIVGPNKASVYAEYLPDFIKPAQTRYINTLLAGLKSQGLNVFDPTDLLKAKKNGQPLYFRADTHWNLLGAHLAAEGFFDLYRRLDPSKAPTGNDLPPVRFFPADPVRGDLISIGNFLYYQSLSGDNFTIEFDVPYSTITVAQDGQDQAAAPESFVATPAAGSPTTVINPQAPSKIKVYAFVDSFSVALSPFLNTAFAEVTYFSHTDLWSKDPSWPDDQAPDLVIFESVERDF